MNIIEMCNVTKAFNQTLALDQIELGIPEGSIYGIIGANGAGKSTLLRLAVGLFRATTGHVEVFGQPIRPNSDFYQRVHYVSSDIGLYKDLRVDEMLRIVRSAYPQWNLERERQLLRGLCLPENHVIRSLSTGTQAQLRIVIALSAMPNLLVLDEATHGLDPLVKNQIIQLLIETAAVDGMTIVFATQQIDEVERMADQVAMMAYGHIVSDGNLDDMRQRFREVQFIRSEDIPHEFLAGARRVRRHEEHWSVVIDSDLSGWAHRLQQIGAEHVVVHDLDLSEMFKLAMETEGYCRERVHLS